MPVSGGTADKLGGRYEGLWALDRLMSVVAYEARDVTLEPLDPVESKGIEFRVSHTDGTIEFWSVKRQTTGVAGWTLPKLAQTEANGRSILSDLVAHVERSPKHVAVFASTLGAPHLQELRDYAADASIFDARLSRATELKERFRKHLLPILSGDVNRAREFLLRLRSHAEDEARLLDITQFRIRMLLYATDGSPIDIAAVRTHLSDLLVQYIGRPIDRQIILDALGSKGIGSRDWATDRTVSSRIAELCDAYVAPIQSGLINGTSLTVGGSEGILDLHNTPLHARTLVIGRAGAGKSCTLASAVQRLRAASIPVVPIRFDQLPEGILTTTELGRKLNLPESPVSVLAGVASGKSAVLVVDQLDAVSLASGRRSQLWSLFEALCREVERVPALALIVGCREFDLEHDHRMRSLKAAKSSFVVAQLLPLTPQQIDLALASAGIAPNSVQDSVRPILTIPIQLSMYLSLSDDGRAFVHERDGLFDRFWVEKELRTGERLGRRAAWTEVIDRLTQWLSSRQTLFAPAHVLDEYAQDAKAMTSEHVLALVNGQYCFFHESFFDYAFARRFAAVGGRLVDLLLSTEQHLFRRAQLRQILAFLRGADHRRYLDELEAVLGDARIRFHLKRSVFRWMSSLGDPQRDELDALRRLMNAGEKLLSHGRSVLAANLGWFDVLDNCGFFEDALESGDPLREDEAIWMLGLPDRLKQRSRRVAELARRHRRPGSPWNDYLRFLCRTGNVHYSREFFDFFLSLITDGTLDGLRPGFALNDDWWSVLHPMSDENPEYACEAIRTWFDRVTALWDGSERLRDRIDLNGGSGVAVDVIETAASKAPRVFAELLLPSIAAVVARTSKQRGDRLDSDPVWTFRAFGDRAHSASDGLLVAVVDALENLAGSSPEVFDQVVAPYVHLPHDTIAYVLLRGWTASHKRYADEIIDYLVADPRRLKVGYAYAGEGSAAHYVSVQAVRSASTECTLARFAALENAILGLTDTWETVHPQSRGLLQLELLRSLDTARLSARARRRLDELARKFPRVEMEEPRPTEFVFIGSPIPDMAMTKMSEDQWLGAMRKYARRDLHRDRTLELKGGEHELANALERRSAEEPRRFAALAAQMTDDFPASYFDAIVRGVMSCIPTSADVEPPIPLEHVVSLLVRVHALRGRPCGRAIAWSIEKTAATDWPTEVIDLVAWYAQHDPDPTTEMWRAPGTNGKPTYDDPHSAGINSTRGAIACAIARLIGAKSERLSHLQDAVFALAHDRIVSVRACAVRALGAAFATDPARATSWFVDCIGLDPILLDAPFVDRLIYAAGRHDYASIRATLRSMMASSHDSVVEKGARLACLLALDTDAAEHDAADARGGARAARKSAAAVYATNAVHAVVGGICRGQLKPFLADPDAEVRAEAATVFDHVDKLATSDQAGLLSTFLDATPSRDAVERVVRALEDSPVQLPDLVCRLVEQCVDVYREDGADIRRAGAMVAMDLSKIIVRLYAQSPNAPSIQSRCLDLIDSMELHNFHGLADELQRLDR